MFVSIYGALAAGAALLTVVRKPSQPGAVRDSEEMAHAAAAENKGPFLETRREARYRTERFGTASLMGESNRQVPCRIINASRSGLRIASGREFPKGAQVCVQWGEQFFVGAVLYTCSNKSEHIAGLELLSGNHRWHPLARLCFWRRLVGNRG